MLGDQVEDFACRDRFAHMVLGIVALSQRISTVAELPRSDGGVASGDSLADFFLGVISVGRTLRATLSCGGQNLPSESTGQARATDDPPALAIQLGLLR